VAEEIKRYKDFLCEVFPQFERVRKVSLNAGLNCPNIDGTIGSGGCAYCNNSSFSCVAQTAMPVLEQLEMGIRNIMKKSVISVVSGKTGVLAYFQNYTNTYAPVQKLREIFMPIISHNNVAGIAIGTRPDCLEPPVVELLSELNKIKPVIVEIGVQTINDETLKNINRGHDSKCIFDATERCIKAGLKITAHVIIGLPGETREDFSNTAHAVKKCGFSTVKIHPLHIVKETRLANEYKDGKIKLLSLEEYSVAAAEFIRIMQPDIAIERVSGESRGDTLIAPAWSGDRELIWELVLHELGV